MRQAKPTSSAARGVAEGRVALRSGGDDGPVVDLKAGGMLALPAEMHRKQAEPHSHNN